LSGKQAGPAASWSMIQLVNEAWRRDESSPQRFWHA